ncbi:hypothetical protein [Lactiplantibacillus paraxiangfangensis]|uniref:hypothetical protein n=1 Tax=Lactiplantibacillus paraxiangfangensis TaxID=3076224 RepID=UPI0030C6983F
MIKRGSKVVWNRPAFDKIGDGGKKVHRNAETIQGRCFGVLKRRDGEFGLLMRHGKSKMIDVPLDQLEEADTHG